MSQEQFEHHQIKQALYRHYGEPVSFDILLKLPILYHEWESDGYAFVVITSKNDTLFIDSDHGSLFVNSKFKEKLEDKKEEYKKHTALINDALKKLSGSK